MNTLSLEQMEKLYNAHAAAEYVSDLEATMATVVADPHYEWPTLGWRIDGRDAVREMYRRILPATKERNMTGETRLQAVAADALVTELYVSFDTATGERFTTQSMVVMVFGDGLIVGERTYADESFGRVILDYLGGDFGEVPGVSRI
jgi:hypothetical protein